MKNTLTTIALLTFSLSSFANNSEFIEAQMNITRGKITNLKDGLNNKTHYTEINATDYFEQLPNEERKIDLALKNFEEEMEKNVFAPLAVLVDDYNSTYNTIKNSQQFSEVQKLMLLKNNEASKLGAIESQIKKSQANYISALEKVYTLVPYALENYTISQKNYRRNIFKGCASYDLEITFAKKKYPLQKETCKTIGPNSDTRPEPKWDEDMTNISHLNLWVENNFSHVYVREDISDKMNDYFFAELIYPKLKGTCKSTICIGLRAADQITLLKMLREKIDNDITFTLQDSKEFTIQAIDSQNSSLLNTRWEKTYGLLTRTSYPEQLPFSVNK